MGLSKGEAYEALELPVVGADTDSIRTSYKRLAQKWHPDKHKNSPESIKNFLEISMAYKRLNIESDIVQMSVGDCLELYQHTFNNQRELYSNGFNISDEDDSDYDDDDDELDYLYPGGLYGLRNRLSTTDGTFGQNLTPEEIEKNANELITEEEKEKRRAEKRRAKKKRRREKKRQEKQAAETKKIEEPKKKPNKKDTTADVKSKGHDKNHRAVASSSESDTEDFDQNAAFFTQVVNKKKKAGPNLDLGSKHRGDSSKTTNGNDDSVDDLDPVVLRSRQLAIEGNKMANAGHYQAAIDLFTEAVKLDSRDFRFFGNRSYCYDRMHQYEKALKDADRAITLAPDWPKGYFRKGRALAGLKLYPDAEQAFMQVLKLDRNCDDAMQELLRVRTHQLTEMGFSQAQAQNAIRQYDSVQQALDSLLAGMVVETSLAGEVYMSDDEDYPSPTLPSLTPSASGNAQKYTAVSSHPLHQAVGAKPKMDPKNPEGLTALWVGNVLPEVTEKKLQGMFAKFGLVTSVRLLPEKYCAFVNFKNKEFAGAAMKGLQGAPCAGQQLLIKFPDNPLSTTLANTVAASAAAPPVTVTASIPLPTTTSSAKKSGAATTQKQSSSKIAAALLKVSGPVNGDECYFWRTTGCQFGDDCRHGHVDEHKGIDRKPWQI